MAITLETLARENRKKLAELQGEMGHRFKDVLLLQRALFTPVGEPRQPDIS